ncbi:hypothetical protein E2562_021774 [Oryza meyeriana var. granulata]|uniref:Uncharacterized protein n=1 Tax=Oryza meyeriana var. granulata TaxID=110450 RepID=A0A6G1EXZ1_9ORYZ|nr:hypothetical protein E2562_021774 [Oryza meyeriana var. granulata]
MVWRGEKFGGGGSLTRVFGGASKEKEEDFYGAGVEGSRLGFAPGYGFTQQSRHGRGWQRRGFRARGPCGFAQGCEGFVGRAGREVWGEQHDGSLHLGDRARMDGSRRGRAEKE